MLKRTPAREILQRSLSPLVGKDRVLKDRHRFWGKLENNKIIVALALAQRFNLQLRVLNLLSTTSFCNLYNISTETLKLCLFEHFCGSLCFSEIKLAFGAQYNIVIFFLIYLLIYLMVLALRTTDFDHGLGLENAFLEPISASRIQYLFPFAWISLDTNVAFCSQRFDLWPFLQKILTTDRCRWRRLRSWLRLLHVACNCVLAALAENGVLSLVHLCDAVRVVCVCLCVCLVWHLPSVQPSRPITCSLKF